jgi:hypothetical protein
MPPTVELFLFLLALQVGTQILLGEPLLEQAIHQVRFLLGKRNDACVQDTHQYWTNLAKFDCAHVLDDIPPCEPDSALPRSWKSYSSDEIRLACTQRTHKPLVELPDSWRSGIKTVHDVLHVLSTNFGWILGAHALFAFVGSILQWSRRGTVKVMHQVRRRSIDLMRRESVSVGTKQPVLIPKRDIKGCVLQ